MPRKTQKKDKRRELLLAAFGGNVEGWAYVGTDDAGSGVMSMLNPPTCPCGHVIRYICNWEHADGRKVHTGNVCVETVPNLQAEFGMEISSDVKALQKKERAQKAQQKLEVARSQADEVYALVDKKFGWNIEKYNDTRGWLEGGEYDRLNNWRWYRRQVGAALKMKSAKGISDRLKSIRFSLSIE